MTDNDIFTVTMRGDRHKHPKAIRVRESTFQELQTIRSGQHIDLLDKNGQLARVKVTSVKTWKRRPNDLDINCKYGLYEYFAIRVRDCKADITVVNIIYDEKEG